jgi:hypothetical protein
LLQPFKALITPCASYAPYRINDKARANELKMMFELKDRVGSYKKTDNENIFTIFDKKLKDEEYISRL